MVTVMMAEVMDTVMVEVKVILTMSLCHRGINEEMTNINSHSTQMLMVCVANNFFFSFIHLICLIRVLDVFAVLAFHFMSPQNRKSWSEFLELSSVT